MLSFVTANPTVRWNVSIYSTVLRRVFAYPIVRSLVSVYLSSHMFLSVRPCIHCPVFMLRNIQYTVSRRQQIQKIYASAPVSRRQIGDVPF